MNISESVRSWQDQRSDPTSYGDLGGLLEPGTRADNLQYTSRSNFRPWGVRLHEIQCDLSLPDGGKPHVIYYEPYPALHRLRGFSPIANRTRTANSLRACLLDADKAKSNRALLANHLLGDIRRVIPNAATLTQREQELGKPENIVVIAMHGGQDENRQWTACIQTNSIGDSRDLGSVQDLIKGVIEYQHGNVDRIIISACNPGSVDIAAVSKPHLRVNYAHGDIREGLVPEYVTQISPTTYMEYDSDTNVISELVSSPTA